MAFGDYDDAVDVIDIWLSEHPVKSLWERELQLTPVLTGGPYS